MKTRNIIKALEKQGYIVQCHTDTGTGYDGDMWKRIHYTSSNAKYKCSWYHCQVTGSAQSVHASLLGQDMCILTDYFPGWFPKTIKQLINYMGG